MSASSAAIKPMPVVASSAVASVNVWATITPDRSTPRWSFFQPRWPRPPCFAAAHSPSPTIERPVLSTMRWIAPWPGRGAARRRGADSGETGWCGRALRDRRPSRRGPTVRSPPLGARATGRRAGTSTRSRSRGLRTAAARRGDRTATVATCLWRRWRTTRSRRVAGRVPARTSANFRPDTLVLYFGGRFNRSMQQFPPV